MMSQKSDIIFVCEHGAAKSILAAAYFNGLASEKESDLRAIARGTHPDAELSPQTVLGLSKDGLHPTESTPQKLTEADVQSAEHVLTFCDLSVEYHQKAIIEQWYGIPPVSEDYEKARDAIVGRIHEFLSR
jgi:protein-tyrosine-phosphatase